ncbi:MAG: TRAP transporter small permease [Pseudomonadales bacterium]
MNSSFERTYKRGLEWSGMALVFSLIIIVVLAVVLRKLGLSLQWYDEIASILLAWITYIGAALAALNRSHLGFPDLVASLPRKAHLIAFIFTEIVVLMFFVLLIYGFIQLLPVMRGMGLASLPGIPVWFVQLALPIGSALFIVSQIISMRGTWEKISTVKLSRLNQEE